MRLTLLLIGILVAVYAAHAVYLAIFIDLIGAVAYATL
jgi:hypothetical protein